MRDYNELRKDLLQILQETWDSGRRDYIIEHPVKEEEDA